MNVTEIDPVQLEESKRLHYLLFLYICFHVSGLCLLVWDYFLTFSMEFDFFWLPHLDGAQSQFSIVRLLFFVNRYLPLFSQAFFVVGLTWPNISPSFCKNVILRFVHSTVVVQWFAIPGAILCCRTCALYKGDRRIVWLVVSTYLASLTASAFIVGFSTKKGDATASLDPGVALRVCHNVQPDKIMFAAFIPPIIFDVCASSASLFAILRHWRRGAASHGSQLVTGLATGTIVWFIVVFTSNLLNLCIYAFVQMTLRHVFNGLMFAIISIASSRQLFHLRKLGRSSSTSGQSDLSFSSPSGLLPAFSPSPRAGRFSASISGSTANSPSYASRTFGDKLGLSGGFGSPSVSRHRHEDDDDYTMVLPLSPMSPPPKGGWDHEQEEGHAM